MIVNVRATANCFFAGTYHCEGDIFRFELTEGAMLPPCLELADESSGDIIDMRGMEHGNQNAISV